MDNTWQQTDRTDYVKEYFWRGEFIQSNRWLASSPPKLLKYPYEKDFFKYSQKKYEFDNEILVTEMTHATSFECMRSIINDIGFKPKEKHYPGISPMSLVWFGLKIEEKEIDCIKENSKSKMQHLMQTIPGLNAENVDKVLSKIARSSVFQPMSRYGHFKFTIKIKEVLDAYTIQFCDSSPQPEMRKLGTFAYKQEIMHVILVCCSDTPDIDSFPVLSGDPVIQSDEMMETWKWKPHSTGCEYISFNDNGYAYYDNMRWEHVVFAFYVPKGSCLKIPDVERRVSLCLEMCRTWNISDVNEDIKKMLNWIESTEANNKKLLANTLLRMIAGYLKEERLYEKTTEWQKHVRVDLGLVVQRLQEMLKVEFEELNWRPFTEWMDSLTRHNYVLHVIQNTSIKL